MAKNRFIISGGGTGGHIYPAISIADQLKKKVEDCNILFVGAKKRTIDNLTVQKITIVDESGNQVGEIGNKQLSSYFWLKSQRNIRNFFGKLI